MTYASAWFGGLGPRPISLRNCFLVRRANLYSHSSGKTTASVKNLRLSRKRNNKKLVRHALNRQLLTKEYRMRTDSQ